MANTERLSLRRLVCETDQWIVQNRPQAIYVEVPMSGVEANLIEWRILSQRSGCLYRSRPSWRSRLAYCQSSTHLDGEAAACDGAVVHKQKIASGYSKQGMAARSVVAVEAIVGASGAKSTRISTLRHRLGAVLPGSACVGRANRSVVTERRLRVVYCGLPTMVTEDSPLRLLQTPMAVTADRGQ